MTGGQPRCPRCHQWAGWQHQCQGEPPRCANPRCRRLLSAVLPRHYEGQLCTRCQIVQALGDARPEGGRLPVNTGRPRRAPSIGGQVREQLAALERRSADRPRAEAPAGRQAPEAGPPLLWRRMQLRARSALFGALPDQEEKR